ncbi:TPA: SpaH/EbpB family LPXTG-anchored major pilin [Streptococcus suis]
MKLIKKLVTGLMILLVALGSSPLEVFALPNNGFTEWPTGGYNDVTSTLPLPPAIENIVDLRKMFEYPTLNYSKIPRYPTNGQILDFSSNKSYVTKDDSSVAVLTRDSKWQSGVMWSKDEFKVKLNEPFHMVSYIYLGDKGQTKGGADGITFTMHNDNKTATETKSGSTSNTGNGAYGALGNGLGVYGNYFSGADNSNVYVQMEKGVTNGIALEFDTFYNDEINMNGKQFTDTDLWQYIEKAFPPPVDPNTVKRQKSENTKFGHIAINYLNDMQGNIANDTGKTFDIVPKHAKMLSVGWDGEISELGLDYVYGWQVSTLKPPKTPLADSKWHRLEVKWTPNLETNTGNLNYKIYKHGHGHEDSRKIYKSDDDTKDGTDFINYDVAIGSTDYPLQHVFGENVKDLNNSVYWGFSGSTGGSKNNQAVQMLQLPVNYYTAELSKVDQGEKPVSGARFQIQKKNETTGDWEAQKIYNPDPETPPETPGDGYTLETGTQDEYMKIYDGVYQSLGKIKLTQLTSGTYRWKEIAAPAGYQLDKEYYPKEDGFLVNFSESQKQEDKVFKIPATNSRLFQVSLEKKASDTEAPLAEAVFSLQKDVDGNWEPVSQDGVSEFTTNSEGKITISNLKAGKYRWKEVTAPDGYQISQPDPYVFDVTKDSDSNLAIDPDTNNYIINPTIVENDRKFELVLEKLEKLSSTSNRPIGEVEFMLYSNFNGTTFSDEITREPQKTDSKGEIVFGSDLIEADKTYYLVETNAADGFIALNGYFKVVTSKKGGIKVSYESDGETNESPEFYLKSTSTETDVIYSGKLTIYNKRRESILPTTGGNGILGYVGIGLTMTIVALLFFIARKRIFKWLIILLVATSGLAGLAGGTQVVSAQEQEQVQLEVNRLVYQPSDRQYKSGVPVAGAKLEVVDVTKSFYELVNRQKLSLKEAQEAVSKSNKIDGQSLAVATTDQSGLVRFTVSKTSQQRPAVYLIRELVTPVAVTKMENMVVVLPILDESGNEKSLISLFPKSHGTFTFDKTIDEKQSSYSFGEPIPYRLSTIIPQDMPNLSSYEIEDIYDQGLRFISKSLEIFIDGEKQSDSTKAVSLSENQFRVVFDVAKLADFSGKKLEVTYQMVIKDEAAIDQDLVNTATLYPGDLTPLVDRENVRTGGFRFIKRAAEGKQNPLAKATFVIKNPTDDTVLTYKEGKYQFEKVATNASGVVRLTSDDDGYFEIRGLRYGEYLVSEIRAPSGYVLQDKPTAFTVGVSTFSQGPVLSIFNVKKPKIRLPETGTVATSTAFVGLLIMASSLVMIRRRKDN